MSNSADLYNTSYGNFETQLLADIRSETYGEDLGQTGWMTADEMRGFIRLLKIKPSFHVLEVGCGSGGAALFLSCGTGCRITGIDINAKGIRNANRLAARNKLRNQASFRRADCSRKLPFVDNCFDALICNDVMCHVPHRAEVLADWLRILKPGARMLFTDALVITGLISNEEIATRSMIGNYFFLPVGENERLIRAAGFALLRRYDLTPACTTTATRWHNARAKRATEVTRLEGAKNFRALQDFLWCVRTVTFERRLSRFAYLALKPG